VRTTVKEVISLEPLVLQDAMTPLWLQIGPLRQLDFQLWKNAPYVMLPSTVKCKHNLLLLETAPMVLFAFREKTLLTGHSCKLTNVM
jgi:hypothetical protein